MRRSKGIRRLVPLSGLLGTVCSSARGTIQCFRLTFRLPLLPRVSRHGSFPPALYWRTGLRSVFFRGGSPQSCPVHRPRQLRARKRVPRWHYQTAGPRPDADGQWRFGLRLFHLEAHPPWLPFILGSRAGWQSDQAVPARRKRRSGCLSDRPERASSREDCLPIVVRRRWPERNG